MKRTPTRLRQSRRVARLLTLVGGISAPILAAPSAAHANITQEATGSTVLQDINPTLTGAGVSFAQAEGESVTNQFEVTPSNVYQPSSKFVYINDGGMSAAGFPNSVGASSAHADFVGGVIFGGTFGAGAPSTPGGIAYGLTTINSYSAQYIFDFVNNSTSIPVKIVNQSFDYVQNTMGNPNLTGPQQEQYDSIYDNYVDTYGTIFVSAAGSTGAVTSPGTAYNSIGVGMYNGGFLTGPTIDNGRSKPDISSVAGQTSIATAEVSGVTILLYQAAAANLGGAGTSGDATDARTIKALLLNGAIKEAGWSHTTTQPLDLTQGAGIVYAYNSYHQLIGGEHHTLSVGSTSIGGAHSASASVNVSTPLGWDFSTITSTSSSDSFKDYVFQPATGPGITGYDLTTTLIWNRPLSDPNNENIANPINNLYLYLFNATTSTATTIDSSVSTLDNVQQIYDTNLTPGDVYDIQLLKHGGTVGSQGVLSNTETYALAFNFQPDPIHRSWVQPGGGSWGTQTNWATDVPPNAAGAAANFSEAVTGPFNITLDANQTVGQVIFNSTNSYTLSAGNSPSNTLIFDWGGNTAYINDMLGNHSITAPVQLNSNTSVIVAGAGNTLTLSNAISGAGTLNKSGPGTLVLGASNSYAGPTTISGGAMVLNASGALPSGAAVINNGALTANASNLIGPISGSGMLNISATGSLSIASGSSTSTQTALSITTGGLLNIKNNSLTLNYSANTIGSPNATIRNYISSAYNVNGTLWTGTTGITSSNAAADPGHHTIAFADGADGVVTNLPAGVSSAVPAGGVLPAGSELVTYAFPGDANLDGKVDFNDFVAISTHFLANDINWDHGNFNYDGVVDFNDFVVLSTNFGEGVTGGDGAGATAEELAQFNAMATSYGISSAQINAWDATISNLPEPGSFGLIAVGAMCVLRRRARAIACSKRRVFFPLPR
jgi:autotransporter-associated beta strand protein